VKKITEADAQADIDMLREEDKIRKRLRADPWADMRPYTAEVLAWARSRKGSKTVVKRLLLRHFNLDVSEHRVYHFVKSINDNLWPHNRKNSKGNQSNG
jgi:hypothetical protein